MEVKIRNAEVDDIDAMKALLRQLFSIETDFAVDGQRQRQGLALMLDGCQKHRCVKVAEADGEVKGMVTAQLLMSTAEGGVVALIEDLVVDDGFRRRGIGRRLMDHIEKWCHDHGASRMQLLADRNNRYALDFYKKIGWQSTRMICLRRP